MMKKLATIMVSAGLALATVSPASATTVSRYKSCPSIDVVTATSETANRHTRYHTYMAQSGAKIFRNGYGFKVTTGSGYNRATVTFYINSVEAFESVHTSCFLIG